MELNIKGLKKIEEILLCRVNKKVIGQLRVEDVTKQSRSFDDLDEIEMQVEREYDCIETGSKKINPNYDELIEERLLCIDGEYYVIKNVSTNRLTNIKTITAFGLEKKLEKINIVLSDVGLALMDSDEENNIYSFNDELYRLSGWRLGYVANSVRYMEDGKYKVRIQEDTDKSLYDFITNDIQDHFLCIPVFDRKNKVIHLYDYDSFGDKIKLVLTKDNYIKSLEKVSNSNDIVTRLKLKGNEEKCDVRTVTPTGLDYIENYSYFAQMGEMSDELLNALFLFEKITPDRISEWNELTTKKNTLQGDLANKQAAENRSNSLIQQYQAIIEEYQSKETETEKYDTTELETKKMLEQESIAALDIEIAEIEKELKEIDDRITILNRLCQRETAETYNGELIFTDELLQELKEFTYYDTYSDDSFTDANELVKTGKLKLERRCKPDIEWNIDSVDFTERIISDECSNPYSCDLGLGDLISLYDKEKKQEELAYFVGYTKDYKNKSLTLTLSNKKTKYDNNKKFADKLNVAKNNDKILKTAKHIINNSRYNKVKDEDFYNNYMDVDIHIPSIIQKHVISSITFPVSSIELDVNEPYTLVPEILPEDADDKEVIWNTSNSNVATVDNGNIVGLKYGSCVISAISKDGKHTATCKVIVGGYVDSSTNIDATSITISNPNINVDINGEVYLIARVYPDNATNQTLTFSSSDEKIATINKNGLVVGKKAGTCKVIASWTKNPKIQSSAMVTVSNVKDDEKVVTLKSMLLIGDDRVVDLRNSNLTGKVVIDCKKGVDATYFYSKENNRIKKYPTTYTAVVISIGNKDVSASGIANMKQLIKAVTDRYKSKKVYVVQELVRAITYDSEGGTYKGLNKQIDKYNEELRIYCNAVGALSIDASSGLEEGDMLNALYSTDGKSLNELGNKIFWNNIVSEIKNSIVNPVDEDDQDSVDDKRKDDDKKDDDKKKDDKKKDNKKKNNKKKVVKNVARDKIVDRANDIIKLTKNKKAWYSQYNRTIDWNHKQIIRSSHETISSQGRRYTYKQPGRGRYGFDCSSLVGVCYQAAGYNFMKGLSCAGGTLQSMAKKHGATMWRYIDDKSLKKAKPGDIVMFANDRVTLTKTNMATVRTHHTAIYMGNGYIVEASGYSTGIVKRKRLTNKCFFMRIKELDKADKETVNNKSDTKKKDTSNKKSVKEGNNCYNEKGTKDGHKYVYKFSKARCTNYGGNPSSSASGIRMKPGYACAAHNIPFNSKIYIPALRGKPWNPSGIYVVLDGGGYCFDFDLFLGTSESSAASKMGSPIFTDVFVLSWGNNRVAPSFTQAVKICKKYYNLRSFHKAWLEYSKYGCCTLNFHKFNDEDKNFKKQSWYKNL